MKTARATTILTTLALLAATSFAFSQTEPQSPPMKSTKSGKEPGAAAAEATPEKKAEKVDPGISKQKKLSMCVETWDAQTHMTKKEWRVACARSVRDYPDAFDR